MLKDKFSFLTSKNVLEEFCIPHSRQNPKILWIDDAEVVGDGVAEIRPVLRDFLA